MKQKVLDAIAQFSLIKSGDTVTVALSGGADSVALLYVLLECEKQLNIKVQAAHFNHLIRGDEAGRDEQFVKELCEKLDVELFCGREDVPLYAKEHKMSLELAARTLRYEFLSSVSRGIIATAHTASDNLETVLFNLTRGSSIKGLCGIPARRDNFIRPLIFCTRQDIEDYCKEKGASFVTDSTNLSDDYTRNNIRHNIVPILKQINPSAESTVVRTGISLREDNELLECWAKAQFEGAYNSADNFLDIKKIWQMHPAVLKRVLLIFYKLSIASDADSYHINELYKIALSGGKTGLPENKSAVSKNGILKIISNDRADEPKYRFSVKITEKKPDFSFSTKNVNNLFLKNTFDCDKIVGNLVVRTRQTGDKIKLKNKNCTKSLKKLYNEYAIPMNLRESLPVIADDEGIVWIYKIGVSERCAANDNTTRIYTVETDVSKGCLGEE